MKSISPWARSILIMAVAATSLTAAVSGARAAAPDARDDASPWAIATGAEWAGEYPRFNPMLSEAGVTWLRMFPEWQTVQPKPGQWNWQPSDNMVADAKKNDIHLLGIWCYFAKFASADGGTRKGPIKDMQMWRDYVTASVNRYKTDIKYWEVWNEFNGSFYSGDHKVRDYADLTVAAFKAAKKADPTCKIGMSVASSDIGFLDLAIKAGAAGHFDYVCVHPYENTSALMYGDEVGYLGLAQSLRQMLAANGQSKNIQLWITEIGYQAPIEPDAAKDKLQAEALIKTNVMSLAQGFAKMFWFEARGPAYGHGTDHGIIRADWSKRPAYDALKTLSRLLGKEPHYTGWLNLDAGAFGFMFRNADQNVLVAWAPMNSQYSVTFDQPVRVMDYAGVETKFDAGKPLALTAMPVFILDVPAAMAAQARSQAGQPFPWGGDYSKADAVTCRLGETNADEGLSQIFLREDHENRSVGAIVNGEACRKMVSKDKDNNCAYFRVVPSFIPFGPRALDITVVAKRVSSDKPADMAITYETLEGYKNFQKGGEHWAIPAGDGWQEHTFRVTDACFANRWGWHLGLISGSDTAEFLVKEVRISKVK